MTLVRKRYIYNITLVSRLHHARLGTIQVLRNAVGAGRVSDFPEKSVTKMYGSTLLALRWVSNFQKKRYITLTWPLILMRSKVLQSSHLNEVRQVIVRNRGCKLFPMIVPLTAKLVA